MSFLGLIFNGISTLLGYQGQPIKRNYSKIRVYGEADFDDIHVRNYVMSEEEINNLEIAIPDVWTGKTIMLAQFENENLTSGNVSGLTESIIYWEINRRELGSTLLTKLDTIPVTQTQYIDITAAPNKIYEYVVFGISENQISEPLVSPQLKSDFYNHILIQPDTKKAFVFDLNTQTGTIENETDVTRHDGFGKYSAYSYGLRDFEKSSISAIPGSVSNGGLSQAIEVLRELKDVINDQKDKLYKTRKGEILWVTTIDSSRQLLSDSIEQQPFIVTFNWEETGKEV